MKGLYWQPNSSGEETSFVFLEKDNLPVVSDNYVKVQVKACALSRIDTKVLSEIKLEKEFLPVGREIAGVVLETGNKVSFFQPHDEVVGILPLDSEESGLCEVVLVHEHYLAHKPEKVSWLEAAGTIRDGVRAYTALHYLSYISPGKTVLVMDGASPFGTIAIQLAQHRGAKVISTIYSLEDKQYLERLTPSVARIIDESNGRYDLTESCLEETGGLGVDIVLDAGVRLYTKENEATSQSLLPHKHDIITLLSVGGHWVTMEENLQLDPPDSRSLFLKGATVSFLNDEVWNLSNMHQGKYLCILDDIMEKLSNGVFRPCLDDPIPLYEAKVSMEMVQKNPAKKRQVVRL
ncbi:quinone oxidoreductase-like protein 1 isoform X1 [Rhineura floridana]|uniref:quinone oxidoreductase-like protein 1 isoform X1 n=1 Tax=Rhineura floridana TaxID=261503 RepID=UPI002AC83736|nr:quinone oxidoreductase-like protein 1 isoform X1 [Rhineura floridana]XP_061483730.1 quinone oxidoreductase-like protein 1 isoform X1 [Rhineura floridana]XP_061483731.1 quinone oxidoreductase-like protein 1 isoform X1 [Rhineura floridana]